MGNALETQGVGIEMQQILVTLSHLCLNPLQR